MTKTKGEDRTSLKAQSGMKEDKGGKGKSSVYREQAVFNGASSREGPPGEHRL